MARSLVIATEEPHAPTPRPVLLISDPSLDRIVRPFTRVMRMVSGGSDPGSLSGRAAQSGVWIGGGFVIQRVLQLGSNLILTRLLFPEAFGLMALATIFLVGLQMLSDLGLKSSIIRDPKGSDPLFLNTAWTLQVIRGFALFLAGCLLAYPISVVYGQPILFPLLMVMSFTAVVTGFQSIKISTSERDLDFRVLTIVQVCGQIISIISLILLTFIYRSVWALAIGTIIGSAVTMVLGHILLKGHRHRLALDREAIHSLLHFGKWIFLSTVATYLGGEGLRAIQGGFLTPSEFGVLAIAYTIAAIPIDIVLKLTASIGFPSLSEAVRRAPGSLASVLQKFRTRTLLIAFVLVTGVALTSEILIRILYDERYHSAGIYVTAITLSNAVSLINTGYNNALLALGKSKTYFAIMTMTVLIRILGTVIGFQFLGILGMIYGVGLANALILLITYAIMRTLNLGNLKTDIGSLFFIIAILALSSAL
jgi:O-antigen/teichoic acid export membrane protein